MRFFTAAFAAATAATMASVPATFFLARVKSMRLEVAAPRADPSLLQENRDSIDKTKWKRS